MTKRKEKFDRIWLGLFCTIIYAFCVAIILYGPICLNAWQAHLKE